MSRGEKNLFLTPEAWERYALGWSGAVRYSRDGGGNHWGSFSALVQTPLLGECPALLTTQKGQGGS